MRLPPRSAAFTLMLGALAALPSFGIDMNLPALDATARSFGIGAERAGLTISLFMLGYALAPPVCGPLSDRIGRRPVLLGALVVFTLGSLGCAAAHGLPGLLAWRIAQGMGAGVTTTLVLALNNDLFDGAEAEAGVARLASVMLFVPMLAPAAGSAVLALAGWRGIFFLLAALGGVLLCVVWAGLAETARRGTHRPAAAALLEGYARAIRHPVCVGHILVNAAGFGLLFAYISGSSLLLIDWLGLSLAEYSLAYAVSFLGIMAGVQLNVRLGARGMTMSARLTAGIVLALAAAASFSLAIVAGSRWAPGLTALLTLGTIGFGLIAPNAILAAMQPLPDHAGAVSAMCGFTQVLVQSLVSAAVVSLSAWNPGLSIGLTMLACAGLALIADLTVVRGSRAVPADLRANLP